MPSESSQFDLREVLSALWRRKWIVVSTVVVVTAAAYLVKQAATEQEYRASSVVQVRPQAVDLSLFEDTAPPSGSTLEPIARVIKTTRFARLAVKRLRPRPDPRDVVGKITARSNNLASVITITARADSRKRAVDLANAFGRATVEDRGTEAQRTVDLAIKQLESQRKRITRPD